MDRFLFFLGRVHCKSLSYSGYHADTGVYVATVEHIIEAKKKYGRDKDIVDIYNITKSIL